MKRKIKRPKAMGLAEFIETYLLPHRKLRSDHKAVIEVIEMIKSSKKVLFMRPNDESLTAQLIDAHVVVKPYKPKKRKPMVVFDEAANMPDHFFEKAFEGQDKKPRCRVLETKVGENDFISPEWVKERLQPDKSPLCDAYIQGHWPAEAFGVDYAQGKDKSVTVFINKPSEQEKTDADN